MIGNVIIFITSNKNNTEVVTVLISIKQYNVQSLSMQNWLGERQKLSNLNIYLSVFSMFCTNCMFTILHNIYPIIRGNAKVV